MAEWKKRLTCVLALFAGLVAAGCTGGVEYAPAQDEQIGSVHSGSDGGDSGGSSM
jgi:hypothetical protein